MTCHCWPSMTKGPRIIAAYPLNATRPPGVSVPFRTKKMEMTKMASWVIDTSIFWKNVSRAKMVFMSTQNCAARLMKLKRIFFRSCFSVAACLISRTLPSESCASPYARFHARCIFFWSPESCGTAFQRMPAYMMIAAMSTIVSCQLMKYVMMSATPMLKKFGRSVRSTLPTIWSSQFAAREMRSLMSPCFCVVWNASGISNSVANPSAVYSA